MKALLVLSPVVAAVASSEEVVVLCQSGTFGDDATFETSVVAKGSLWFGDDVTVRGSVFAGSRFTAGSDLTVRGDVVAAGPVTLGDDATVGGVVASVSSSVTLEDDVTVGGDVVAFKDVRLGDDDTVRGSVVALGSVTLGDDDTVDGDIIAGGTVKEGDDDTVRGSIASGVPKEAEPFIARAFDDADLAAALDECGSWAHSGSTTLVSGGGLSVLSGTRFEKVTLGARGTVTIAPLSSCDETIKINNLEIKGDDTHIIIPQGATLYVYNMYNAVLGGGGGGGYYKLNVTKSTYNHCDTDTDASSEK